MDSINKLRIHVSIQHFLLTQLYARTFISSPELLAQMRDQFALAAADPVISSPSLQGEPDSDVRDFAVEQMHIFFDDVEEGVSALVGAVLEAHRSTSDSTSSS
jgi:hypothetical protein